MEDNISLETENQLLRGNIRELQEQLQNSYKRIKELREELDNVKVCECPPIVDRD
jgi:predicted RNase H-like nuclease (RuvC/YqgF family)